MTTLFLSLPQTAWPVRSDSTTQTVRFQPMPKKAAVRERGVFLAWPSCTASRSLGHFVSWRWSKRKGLSRLAGFDLNSVRVFPTIFTGGHRKDAVRAADGTASALFLR